MGWLIASAGLAVAGWWWLPTTVDKYTRLGDVRVVELCEVVVAFSFFGLAYVVLKAWFDSRPKP